VHFNTSQRMFNSTIDLNSGISYQSDIKRFYLELVLIQILSTNESFILGGVPLPPSYPDKYRNSYIVPFRLSENTKLYRNERRHDTGSALYQSNISIYPQLMKDEMMRHRSPSKSS
jgi:hypothetical protein